MFCNFTDNVAEKMDNFIIVMLTFSSVDPGSLAEKAGFKVGDQIIEVNGKNFENLTHNEAVEFIKSQKYIMATLKVIYKSISAL